GMARATVYRYFPNREALFEALAADAPFRTLESCESDEPRPSVPSPDGARFPGWSERPTLPLLVCSEPQPVACHQLDCATAVSRSAWRPRARHADDGVATARCSPAHVAEGDRPRW